MDDIFWTYLETFVQEISKTTMDETFRDDMAGKFVFDELLVSIIPQVAGEGKEERLNDLAIDGILD